MRAAFVVGTAACLLLTGSAHAAPALSQDENAIALETPAGREAVRLQSRHHYLFDDESQPWSSTTGSAAANARACASEPVRVRRTDGSTVLQRFNRCD